MKCREVFFYMSESTTCRVGQAACQAGGQAGNREIIQIRRCRPSALAAALALMLTMLFVYAAAMPALPLGEGKRSSEVSAGTAMAAQLRMEGMEVYFHIDGRSSDALQARILAAQCAEDGGAGLVISDGEGYAVVREAGSIGQDGQDGWLKRRAGGLTLKLRGSAENLAAVADAVVFLRSQAMETGSLAGALEQGETDTASLEALLSVYRTQGRRVAEALANLPEGEAGQALGRLTEAVQGCMSRLDGALEALSPASMRLVHAAACAQWIELLEGLQGVT